MLTEARLATDATVSDDRSSSPRRRRTVMWSLFVLLWLVVTYPASVGPSAYLLRLGILSFPTFELIYRPLFNLPESAWQAVYLDRWFGWWMSEAWLPIDGPNAL